MTVAALNSLPLQELQEALRRCCGATAWVAGMCARFPVKDAETLFSAASAIWRNCTEADWKEAFAHHPQIGDLSALREKFAATAQWAAGEQSAVQQADEATLQALAAGNRQYLEKFGYIFIVCATGKPAADMLQQLQERLPHTPQQEIRIAMQEQEKITKLRLEKLLTP
ncbi:2-oxo-4-hydroxy-4-carboxy-5-ureidoimidazoline decarboxylase [Chitinophaga japonensis]|uniref:2-oxo-4-hydroxy-4-carboxy-5-ureidoimidazoline decarboxylase n=1 Tax=Chitinophaga japonensis TaxID=104662 RepID=A0A562T3E8_CHIJA|nr:2-oxo-4-hydroxy-4-carboxy-5-ureidoimidazoline decarboxylase [Chitinophaga japonensis]TWI87923.1 2-oxo-4-hydroxy-4-carboxy-5-ureidoimidazoline decarboxylase [Chitinophaga japonensis]